MKMPMNWAKEFAEFECTPQEFADRMTMSGSKVETYECEADGIKNVVVGKILEIVPHPDSDHMVVCQVDVGRDAPVQIVTGANNLKVGDLVPAALHVAKLPGGKEIRRGKLRGVESGGMLCSLSELGLTTHDFPNAVEDGILVLDEEWPVGTDAVKALGMDDVCVDFEITPNRPDCLAVRGLAREAAATFGVPFLDHEPQVKPGHGDVNRFLKVDIENPGLCYRYVGAVVENVRVKPSPRWMRERLRLCGVRPINNLVDITNYVMLEYGQPMHAFDYRYVSSGKIVVRESTQGETITTLDGNLRPLKPGMLVIADGDKPIGLAGIMGGENSEIVADTTTVVFESANFNGTSIRQTALALGLRTEASGKFEKNLDPMLTIPAVQRACELVEQLACGDVLDGTIDIINHVPQPKQLELEPDRINQLLGTQIPEADMVEYLRRLEIPVEGRTISVPSWRPDLNLTADIAEEVGRLYGYNEIPTTALRGASTQGGYSTDMLLENQAGSLCRALGYSEVITYSFVSPAVFDQIRLPEDSPLRRTLKIQNPLGEDTSVMRTTALPSMLDILGRNSAYHNKSAKLYELAKVYLPTGSVLPQEPKMLVLGTYGEHETFFTLKGELEAVLTGLRVKKPSYTAVRDNPTYHPGRCAKLTVEGVDVGFLGQLHPLAAQNYGLDGEVYCCEVNFTRLLTLRDPEPTYQPLPRYPAVSRDLSLVCDEGLTVAQVEDCMAKAAGKLLRQIRFFDIYRGKGIPEGKKSMAFSLELRADDRTLTDADSEAVVSKVLAALEESLGVTLR